ncbi:MAG: extracellular solute-binding protein [Clostridia bacterium]|nr:extracellular solute-binding protein [Clostridia bacterium]
MRKTTKFAALMMAGLLSVGGLSACGGRGSEGEESVVADGKTVNVRISKAGYGTNYIYKMKEKFEQTYADEGYKINVLVPLSGLGETYPYQQIYSDAGIDLFFVGQEFTKSYFDEYGMVFADISETVFAQSPIKFDGTTEDCTVASKIDDLQYANTYEGKYYGLPYALTVEGLAVNTRVLGEFDLEIPRTTNELFACVEAIMSEVNETGVYPFTYYMNSGQNVSMYHNAWLAQMRGYDGMKEFWSMQDAKTGENLEKPYEVFDEDFEKILTEFIRIMDYNTAAYGATTQDFKTSQNQFMQGDAVFYPIGDWAYNEEKIRNESKLDDVTIVRFPVISALGTKMFGEGTKYGYTAEKCEQILCTVIDGVDANKEAATIKAEADAALSVSLDEADVLELCKRVALISGNSDPVSAVISAKSEVQDIAALFLRMCASDDGASLIAHETLTANPFDRDALFDYDSAWHQSTSKRLANRYMKQTPRLASGYRRQLGLTAFTPYTGDRTGTKVLELELTRYDDYKLTPVKDVSIYATAAKTLAETIYTNAKNAWENGQWK